MAEQDHSTASITSAPIYREDAGVDISQDAIYAPKQITLLDIANTQDINQLSDALDTKIPKEELAELSTDERHIKATEVLRIRNAAFERLATFASRKDDPRAGQALELLSEYVPEHGSSYMKTGTIKLLLHHPEYSETLMKMMGDPYQNGIRNYAACVLKSHIKSHPEIGNDLLDFVEGSRQFTDPIPGHRFTEVGVSLALTHCQSQRAFGYLQNIAGESGADSYAKIVAKCALDRLEASIAA